MNLSRAMLERSTDFNRECQVRALTYGAPSSGLAQMSVYPISQKYKASTFRQVQQQKTDQPNTSPAPAPDFVAAELVNRAKEITLRKLISRLDCNHSSSHPSHRPVQMSASTLSGASSPSVPHSKRPWHLRGPSDCQDDSHLDVSQRVSALTIAANNQARYQTHAEMRRAVQMCEEAETAQQEWRSAMEACHRLYGRCEHSLVFSAMLECAVEVDERLRAIEKKVGWLSEASIEEHTLASGLMSHKQMELLIGESSKSAVAHEAVDSQRALRQELLTESHEVFMLHWHTLQQQLSHAACVVIRGGQGAEVRAVEIAERKLERLQSTLDGLALIGKEVQLL